MLAGSGLTSGEQPIELVCECLTVVLIERAGSAGIDAAAAQRVHEVAHVEQLADVLAAVELAARIQRDSVLLNPARTRPSGTESSCLSASLTSSAPSTP